MHLRSCGANTAATQPSWVGVRFMPAAPPVRLYGNPAAAGVTRMPPLLVETTLFGPRWSSALALAVLSCGLALLLPTGPNRLPPSYGSHPFSSTSWFQLISPKNAAFGKLFSKYLENNFGIQLLAHDGPMMVRWLPVMVSLCRLSVVPLVGCFARSVRLLPRMVPLVGSLASGDSSDGTPDRK